jgi:hypothetical protein
MVDFGESESGEEGRRGEVIKALVEHPPRHRNVGTMREARRRVPIQEV